MKKADIKSHWMQEAAKCLLRRQIVAVGYTNQDEMDDLMWHRAALRLKLDDGTTLIISQDDECNGPGSLIVIKDDSFNLIPVI